MDDQHETVSLTYHMHTAKGALFSDDGVKKNAVWLPLSQIKVIPSDPVPGRVCEVTAPEWLLKKNGLI
jgi:hypothetical protein